MTGSLAMTTTKTSRKPATVFVLQLTPRSSSNGHAGGVPVRPAIMVHATESGLVETLRRVLKAEDKRLKLQQQYDNELGLAALLTPADIAAQDAWHLCYERYVAAAEDYAILRDQLNEIPEVSKLWDIKLTEERVLY